MRKIIVFNMITADGYFEGDNHKLDWHNVDQEFSEFAIAQLEEADTLIFGRRTYEMMASFWLSEIAQKNDPVVAGKMNDMAKLVFSHSLKIAAWQNSTLFESVDRLRELKEQSGKALIVLGSSNLCVSLFKASLIDEVRLMVNPVILGQGNVICAGLPEPLRLELADSRVFTSDNILLRYTVPKSE
jgi:dihydrofolate reductase